METWSKSLNETEKNMRRLIIGLPNIIATWIWNMENSATLIFCRNFDIEFSKTEFQLIL